MNGQPDISFILARDEAGRFRMWACRGAGKGCARNTYRNQKKPCLDCYGPCDENMTLGEVQKRLAGGDA